MKTFGDIFKYLHNFIDGFMKNSKGVILLFDRGSLVPKAKGEEQAGRIADRVNSYFPDEYTSETPFMYDLNDALNDRAGKRKQLMKWVCNGLLFGSMNERYWVAPNKYFGIFA